MIKCNWRSSCINPHQLYLGRYTTTGRFSNIQPLIFSNVTCIINLLQFETIKKKKKYYTSLEKSKFAGNFYNFELFTQKPKF